jgi:isoleucyl-tRNA synthetase
MFKAFSTDVHLPALEESVLKFWRENDIYAKSLSKRQGGPPFVFYEGPPTANGLPHPGHCLTRAIKDLFPRYRTMRGFCCERKAGWDTHGLPVEVEVCKELGLHSKEEIERFGIEPFIQRCQQSVWRYMRQWEQLTERIGFWVNLKDAYVTYHQSFIESVWWSLKQLFDRGLLYKGNKIVWWWAQGGTALSSGEVGQGYREVADPSVYVLFPLIDHPGESLLVWTTTPWTLPSNMFAAVHPDLNYALVKDGETTQRMYIAESLVPSVAAKLKRELAVEKIVRGAELIGARYEPPFGDYKTRLQDPLGKLKEGQRIHHYWRVVGASFVTVESGTGLVHQAPAFGEVDYEVLQSEQARFVIGEEPKLFYSVGPDGRFTDEFPSHQGQWVKDADRSITRELRDKGRLLLQEQYLHDYPFCWRASQDPLIQYPRESWFVRTTMFREEMLANNRLIQWLPEHIRDGRFGNFLESNVDWALSRERYWGTPLPIWVCDATGKMEAVASYDELLSKPDLQGTEVWLEAKASQPELVDDLRIHRPYIDSVNYASPFARGSRMRRVTEVIDCWYDSGAMPFAQWGWPKENADRFAQQFPADFISEAIDQTRGWFYSQLAVSTMLFGPDPASSPDHSASKTVSYPHPFRNCIVLGLMLAEWWESKDGKQRFLSEEEARAACGDQFVKKVGKMSKQLRNYRSPDEIFERYGADALRWYFFANQPPWSSIIYSDRSIRDSLPEFLLRLWNVFSFFTIYAEIDGFDPRRGVTSPGELRFRELSPGDGCRPISQRSEIDRWIMSELQQTMDLVIKGMDAYDNYNAAQGLSNFLERLSNWYVRRSRDRFWMEDKRDPDKLDAYWTLYQVLLDFTKLIAPFVPFMAETLWRELASTGFGTAVPESVHLCDYPLPEPELLDPDLSRYMNLLREIASLGRAARADAKLKVRQPLEGVKVILSDASPLPWLESHARLLQEELNVRRIDYAQDAKEYVTYQVTPNFKRLGPRLGPLLPKVKQWLTKADGAQLLDQLQESGKIATVLDGQEVVLDGEDLQVRLQAKPGWAAAQGRGCVVVLDTRVTPELEREGWANDLIRLIQNQRKESGCRFTERIDLEILVDQSELQRAVEENRETIMRETLVRSLELKLDGGNLNALELGTDRSQGTVTTIQEVGPGRVGLVLQRWESLT